MEFIERFKRRRLPAHLRLVASVEGMISLPEADFLYQLASTVPDGCIVEVGSYRGRSTTALCLGSLAGARVPVYAVDPHESFTGVLGGQFGPEDRAAFFSNAVRTGSYESVRLLNVSSEIVAKGWKVPVRLLWIDGDHSYEGVRRDLAEWRQHLHPDAVVVFDDATDPAIGPFQLILELLEAGEAQEGESIGKVRSVRLTRP